MAGVNKVIILGRLGKDPEVRSFANGGKVCNLSIATSEAWKDKNTGEKKERTEWHRVSILNEALVRIAESYLKKGSEVYIEGQLETRKYQAQDGTDRYTTEIVLRPFSGVISLVGGGGSRDNGGRGSYDDGPSGGDTGGQSGHTAQPAHTGGAATDIDDEIPF